MEFYNLSDSIETILDVGQQPISNRYLRNQEQSQDLYPIALGQCTKTGLLSLVNPMPAVELVPKYDWITYSEPEPHLDDLVEKLFKLPGISKESTVTGVSFKDLSTLQRLSKLGLATREIDSNLDLQIEIQSPGVESIQSGLTVSKAKEIATKYGTSDIIIARHIIEHTYNLLEFSNALKELVSDDGYIVLELPDCEDSIKGCDYTMLWEEHIYYFTENTFKSVLPSLGFNLRQFHIYPYPMENSLVAILTPSKCELLAINDAELSIELERAQNYASQFLLLKQGVHKRIREEVTKGEKLAFFGAGHLACTFIWLFELQELIHFVIDDDINKQAMFMPGSRLPIVGSQVLSKCDIGLCILSVNPISEEKIINKNGEYTNQDGKFISIFPSSPISIYKSLK